MKLKELLELTNSRVELHRGDNGRLVAKSRESLSNYWEVEVKAIYPAFKRNKYNNNDYYSYIYVLGRSQDIENTVVPKQLFNVKESEE